MADETSYYSDQSGVRVTHKRVIMSLLMALALIAWYSGCKAQAQLSSDDEKLQAIIQSHSADDGLWLCDIPATTHNLDTDIAMTVQTRITLTTPILKQIAYKWA